jgi:8-oxo-dGTP pyrophosphatase MutT (NUDIX family)
LRPASLPTKHLSAGMVVVRHDGERYRLLCLRAFDSWDFPKGEVRGDESALDAAVAYTREATGIDDLTFPWGEEYRETVPFDDGRVSRYYMAQTAHPEVVLQVPAGAGSEVDYEYRWLTADESEDVLPPRLALVVDWAVRTLAAAARNP